MSTAPRLPSAPRPRAAGAPQAAPTVQPGPVVHSAPSPGTVPASAARAAVSLPEPGPPRPSAAGGLARTNAPVQTGFMHEVDVERLCPTPLRGDEHLQWLREEFLAKTPVFDAIHELIRRVMQGEHILLRGPDDLTRNVDLALRATLRLTHQIEARTLWTHTSDQLLALSGHVKATLILGGRPGTTYTLAFDGPQVTVQTTEGPRISTREQLAGILRGSYFADVQVLA
ncbi:hypothetical protein [Deinococcus multiflagellatus]|uniref:Uncharacterized protein n=1 Tax=Deinococcus multiflagellatus TaxID=1656887 RepID=A0ABW1ZV29_9DEIO|nr:hypothetical protein [Deinococcus multiflagellatus]MBZ9714487.1 hypothetical protein [Deinococcus multiflagellatus]